MRLSEVTRRFDERLDVAEYADVDVSENGLQVGPAETDVERVAFAVDAAEATADRAVEADADLLVVHHGLSWGGIERVTGRSYRRIAPLIENDVALYAAHLPLDGHQELGNAAGLADLLGLADRQPFGEIGGLPVGQRGRFSDPQSVDSIRATLDDHLDQGGEATQVLGFGPERIESLAILTGSGADHLDDAVAVGADAMLTGEGKQALYHRAREENVTVFLAGHYATETFGVRALADLAGEWGLETTFLDCPTGL